MGAGLRDVMHHTIFSCTGKISAYYSSIFFGARFFPPCFIAHMGFRFNFARSPGLEEGFNRVLNLAP